MILRLSLKRFLLGLVFPLKKQADVKALLVPFKEKSPTHKEHYLHSLRVGLLAAKIGSFLGLPEKPFLYSGIFHDLGKQGIREELLGKKEEWTKEDRDEVSGHVMKGFNRLRGKFDFTADIIKLHHTFQPESYPAIIPDFLYNYSLESQAAIMEFGRILALADVYDALHRVNSKFGELRRLTDQEIEDQMFAHNADKSSLVADLYGAGIFVNSDNVE